MSHVQQVQNLRVTGIGATTIPGTVSEAQLEQTVGVSLIADFNDQLAKISEQMQNQLNQKIQLRKEIGELEVMKSKPEVDLNGVKHVELTKDEAEKLGLVAIAQPKTDPQGRVTGYYVEKGAYTKKLNDLVEQKERQLTELNSTSELVMLQVQSLVDQRKNSLLMLSNLIAARNETMSAIIRNLKN